MWELRKLLIKSMKSQLLLTELQETILDLNIMYRGSANVFIGILLCILVGEVVSQTKLSEVEKQNILDAHNKLRGTVDPPASNMLKMVC